MPVEATKAVDCRIYQAINRAMSTGELTALDEVIDRDAVDHNPAPGHHPGSTASSKPLAPSASPSRTSSA